MDTEEYQPNEGLIEAIKDDRAKRGHLPDPDPNGLDLPWSQQKRRLCHAFDLPPGPSQAIENRLRNVYDLGYRDAVASVPETTTTPPTEDGEYWVRVDGGWDHYYYDSSFGRISPNIDEGLFINDDNRDILWGCKIECPYVDKEGE